MTDNFQVVKSRKRKRGNRAPAVKLTDGQLVIEYLHIDADSLLLKVERAREILLETAITCDLIEKVTLHLKSFDELICYGLGSFSDSPVSRHQLACLLTLKENFKAKTFAYDPVFTPCDIDALNRSGIEVLVKNDEGKTPISTIGNTLVYFPHVPSQLVNNFLWANWNPNLRNCVIISNSFSTVVKRNLDQPDGYSFLRRVLPICEEHIIDSTYPVSSVFNDLAVHSFRASETLEADFWGNPSQPIYEGSTIEFFKKDLVVSLRKL